MKKTKAATNFSICIAVILACCMGSTNNVVFAAMSCESILAEKGQRFPCVDATDPNTVFIGKTVSNSDGIPVDSFLGIEYATQERFEQSELLLSEGLVNATEMGPMCAQPESVWSGPSLTEDCLFLNIWKPASTSNETISEDRLPVMVWIHGGGFIFGSGNHPNFNGANLAGNENVIVVTINYRLNVFGNLPTSPDFGTGGMNGILDQIKALEWVQERISYFGGDPDMVTIFGESAGAISSCQLSVIPQAKGLFRRAISQSGFCGFVPFNAASLTTAIDSLGCPDGSCTIEDLKKHSTEELLALNALHAFQPIHDAAVVAADPAGQFSDSANINPIDMIIGSNTKDDYALFFIPLDLYIAGANIETTPELFLASEDVKNEVLSAYSLDKYGGSAVSSYAEFRGDFDFGCSSRILATTASSTIQGNVYSYLFGRLSGFDLANANGLLEAENIDDSTWSSHEAEIPFVFGNPSELPSVNMPSSFTDEEMSLVEEISSRWASFARTGDPQFSSSTESVEWLPVSEDTGLTDPNYMVFTPDGGTMVDSDENKAGQCTVMLSVYASLAPPAPDLTDDSSTTSSDMISELVSLFCTYFKVYCE